MIFRVLSLSASFLFVMFAGMASAQPSVDPAGRYSGTYRCAQGSTDVTIEIDREIAGRREGRFVFSQPGRRVEGAYRVSVRTDGGFVRLVPSQWERRPPGFNMVGATMTRTESGLAGQIDNAACGRISVQRSNDPFTSSSMRVAQETRRETIAPADVPRPARQVAAATPAPAALPVNPTVARCSDPPSQEILNRLIAQDARGWFLHSYVWGSLRNARLVSGTPCDREFSVRADYTYSGSQTGWILVRVDNGNVDCLEYHDEAGCRPMRGGGQFAVTTPPTGASSSRSSGSAAAGAPNADALERSLAFAYLDVHPRRSLADALGVMHVSRNTVTLNVMGMGQTDTFRVQNVACRRVRAAFDCSYEFEYRTVVNAVFSGNSASSGWIARRDRFTLVNGHWSSPTVNAHFRSVWEQRLQQAARTSSSAPRRPDPACEAARMGMWGRGAGVAMGLAACNAFGN